MIDTHCHLYSEEFTADIIQIVDNAIKQGVSKFYMPAINSETHDAMMLLEDKYPNNCSSMMGLHPCYVKEDYKKELQIVQEWLAKKTFSAIGEIGLDFYWDKTFEQEQYECFNMQMQWAIEKKMPIVIHTRNAMQETINAVKPFSVKGLKGIFHCFSGSYESAMQIIHMGFLLGIGGVITYKNAGLAEVIKKIDLKHLVLETDAPYLTPMPFRGKRNEPSNLTYIVEKIAEVKQVTKEEVIEATTQNAAIIFGS